MYSHIKFQIISSDKLDDFTYGGDPQGDSDAREHIDSQHTCEQCNVTQNDTPSSQVRVKTKGHCCQIQKHSGIMPKSCCVVLCTLHSKGKK